MKTLYQILVIAFFVLVIGGGFALVTKAAPTETFLRNTLPEVTNTYDLGSLTKVWDTLFTREICLSGDCQTSWPGSASGAVATSTGETAGQLAYWTSTNGTPATLGKVATTTLAGNSQVAVSNSPVVIGGSGAVLSIVADSIGDTQLAFNTGQALNTAASPTFAGLTIGSGSGVLKVASGVVGVGADGTDYTLLNAITCDPGEFFSAATAAGAFTCSAPSGSGITAIGPAGQTQTGSTITLASSTSAFNGLTPNLVITGSGDTITFTSSLSGTLDNAGLTNSTISGIALGANLADLTATNSTLTFSGAYNGGTARTVGLNLGNANTWTALQQFNGSASTTLFSAYGPAYFGATATSSFATNGALTLATPLTVANGGTGAATLTGVLKGNGTGAFTAGVDGTDFTLVDAQTCSNQVVTAITAAGVSTCSSINNAYWSGTDLSVANGGTGLSTFGGTNTVLFTTAADTLASDASNFVYNTTVDALGIGTSTPRWPLNISSTTAPQIALSTGAGVNAWTIRGAASAFYIATSSPTTFATSTTPVFSIDVSGIVTMMKLIVTDIIRIPYAAALTLATNGDIGIDSTSNQFKYQSGSATRVLGNGNFYPAFSFATTTAWTGTTTIALGTAYVAETWNGVQCFTDTGTVNVSFYDGTNRMNLFNASTTVGTVTLSSNNTFTAAEKRYVDIGTPASTPTKISCTVNKSLTAD